MRSLRAKAISTCAAALVFAGLLVGFGYSGARRSDAARQATREAEALAEGLEMGLAGPIGLGNLAATQQLLTEAAKSPHLAAVALVSNGGKVLASVPSVSVSSDRSHLALCSSCHAGAVRPVSRVYLDGEPQGDRVQLFRPSAPWSGEDPTYLVLEVVPSVTSPGPFWSPAASVALLGAFILALLGLFHGVLTFAVTRPLKRLHGTAARLLRGDPGVSSGSGGDEIAELTATLEKAAAERSEFGEDVTEWVRDLGARVEAVQAVLAGLGQLVEAERGSVESALLSAGRLSEVVEEVRSSLSSVAGSTSDNSTSLIELSASVDEVAENADSLAQNVASTASAVFQMVQSIQEVAGRVDILARETDMTASSMAQIDASTRQIEQHARDAADLSGRMAEAGQEGSEAVAETLRGIHASYEVIRETARAMEELGESSKAVDGVVKIINEINDKTKLLSLNAAIIAAQAGAHGKSFGVVAHEIKNLSDRTAMSTGEISRIIRGIRDRIEAATEAVARGEDATGRSVKLAERAGGTLKRILETAQTSREMTHEILLATEEQSRGSQRVMAAMQEVSAMVTYIRQAALEHRTSGESVSQSAEIMRDLTEQVKLATAEQADASSYISEAIASIDKDLHDLLGTVTPGNQWAEEVVTLASGLREQASAREKALNEAGMAVREVAEKSDSLRRRVAEALGEGL